MTGRSPRSRVAEGKGGRNPGNPASSSDASDPELSGVSCVSESSRHARVAASAQAHGSRSKHGGGAAWRRSFFASLKGRLELERLNATRETLALKEERAGERRESAEAHEAFGRAEERASALERELESAAGKAAALETRV